MQYAVKQIANLDKPETGVEISRDFSFEVLVCELTPGSVYGFSVCAINSVGVILQIILLGSLCYQTIVINFCYLSRGSNLAC